MSTLRAGTLRHRITIQARTKGQDAVGQPVDIWEDVAQVWANARHLSGTESIKAASDVSVVRASFRIRHRSGINAGMRILHAGAVYDIEAVLPGGRREWVDLAAKRVN